MYCMDKDRIMAMDVACPNPFFDDPCSLEF